MVTAAASSSAADAGNNVLGEGIRTTYGAPRPAYACLPAPDVFVLLLSAGCHNINICRAGIGSDVTIRWGLLKSKVVPPPAKVKIVKANHLIILLCMSCAAYVPSVLFV